MAVRMGLVGGKSMDLETGYDFSKREDRKRAISSIRREEPWLVIGSLPCAAFSIIQNLNAHVHNDGWTVAFEKKKKKKQAIEHMEFCVLIYMLRGGKGRDFVHEHPAAAASWDLECMNRLTDLDDVIKVKADQCASGVWEWNPVAAFSKGFHNDPCMRLKVLLSNPSEVPMFLCYVCGIL